MTSSPRDKPRWFDKTLDKARSANDSLNRRLNDWIIGKGEIPIAMKREDKFYGFLIVLLTALTAIYAAFFLLTSGWLVYDPFLANSFGKALTALLGLAVAFMSLLKALNDRREHRNEYPELFGDEAT